MPPNLDEITDYLESLATDNNIPSGDLGVASDAPVRETLVAMQRKFQEISDFLAAQRSIPVPEIHGEPDAGEREGFVIATGGGVLTHRQPGGDTITIPPELGEILDSGGDVQVSPAKVQGNPTDIDTISVKFVDDTLTEYGDAFNVSGLYLESFYTIESPAPAGAIDPDPKNTAIRGLLEHSLPKAGDILLVFKAQDGKWYAAPPWIQAIGRVKVQTTPTDLDAVSVKMLDATGSEVGDEFTAQGVYLGGNGTGKYMFPVGTPVFQETVAVRSIDGTWYLMPPWVKYGDGIELVNSVPRVDLDVGEGHDQVTDSGLERGAAGIRLSRPNPEVDDVDITYMANPGGACGEGFETRQLTITWTNNGDGRAQVVVNDQFVATWEFVTLPADGHTHRVVMQEL